MASKLAFLVALNLIFFSVVVSACGNNCHIPSNPDNGKTCPIDTLKLGVCAKLLGGLIDVTIGKPPVTPCCSLIQGLADVEAAVCLCTAIKAQVLGNNINIPLSLSLLLNACTKKLPNGFQC